MVPLKRILVPLDGSLLAERALAPAVALAQTIEADLSLLRVTPPLLRHVGAEQYEQIALDLDQNKARIYLSDELARLADKDITLSAHTAVGPIADEIITFSQKHHIDLIIMSSHGRTGPGRWVYGSVAEKVLRQATCATLIIRSQAKIEPFSHNRILVPLDGSSLAEQVLPPAMAIASAVSATVILLGVVDRRHTPDFASNPEIAGELIAVPPISEIEKEVHNYLRQLASRLATFPVKIETHTASGVPADTIIDYATQHAIDLIAIFSHGQSGISRWVLGSVAERVLRGATCATLVVRQPRP